MKDKDIFNKRLDDLYGYVQHSLIFSEAKNGSLVAICIALIVGILGYQPSNDNLKSCMLLNIIPLLFSLGISILSFYPFIRKNKQVKHSNDLTISIFNCENIEKLGSKNVMKIITEDLNEIEISAYEDKKMMNIVAMSKTAAKKYRLFRLALPFFFAFLLFSLILLIINILY